MIKIVFSSILILLFMNNFVPLHAECTRAFSLELRAAAFFHQSTRFRDLYGRVGQNYQIEATKEATGNLLVWINAGWSYQHGKSMGFHNSTTANIGDLSLGISIPFYFREKCMSYVGIGPSFAKIWIKNSTKYHCSRSSKDSIGGVAKVGLKYLLCANTYVDVFADYVYQPMKFHRQINIGGLKTGLGVGRYF
jgi:hypothetical protein